jgi:hypothetical protein
VRFAIKHDVDRGIRRLLAAPRDLPGSAPWTEPPIDRSRASPRHQQAYARYLERLEQVLDVVEHWWAGTLEQQLDQGVTRDKALEQAYRAHFAGPAAAPELVWVVRSFWLECVAINEETPESERVPPEVFLLHWLTQDQRTDAVEVLTGMPYWPIGLDADGRFT